MQARVLNNGMRMVMIRGALAAACLLGFYGQAMAEETATKSTTAWEGKTSAASTKATTLPYSGASSLRELSRANIQKELTAWVCS